MCPRGGSFGGFFGGQRHGGRALPALSRLHGVCGARHVIVSLRLKRLLIGNQTGACSVEREHDGHRLDGLGNCRDEHPSVFFPSDGVGVEIARRICADCPVKDPASSTPWSTASTTACGAAAPSGSGAGSSSAAARQTPRRGAGRPPQATGLVLGASSRERRSSWSIELLWAWPERAGQLRQLGAAEDQQDDEQDDQQFGCPSSRSPAYRSDGRSVSRAACRRWNVWSTSARGAGPTSSTPSPPLPATACSTCTRRRTTTASVLTLAGEDAARAVAAEAVERARPAAPRRRPPPDRRRRRRAVRAGRAALTSVEAVAARDRFAAWAGPSLDLPCFLYGPERTLPDVRRAAFAALAPDTGRRRPHPTAGACAVGARAAARGLQPVAGRARPRRRPRDRRGAPRARHVRALGFAGRRRRPGVVQPRRSAGRSVRPTSTTGGGRGAGSPAPNWWAWCRGRARATDPAGCGGRELDLSSRPHRRSPPRASES